MKNSILIIDFGSQVTQLIARRVREAGVYSEIIPFNSAAEKLSAFNPAGIILSGGPASVIGDATPKAPEAVFEMGVPVLGICYGQQTMVNQLGGKVEAPAAPRSMSSLTATCLTACGSRDGAIRSG